MKRVNYTLIVGPTAGVAEARSTPEDPTFRLNDPAAWAQFLGGSLSDAGESVTHSRAITYSPVWQALAKIAGAAAAIPIDTFERSADGGRTKQPQHDAWPLINLLGQANDETTSWQLWHRAFFNAALWNQAFIWIERQGPRPIGLYNLLPDRTATYRYKGRLWVVTEVNGTLEALPYEDVIHIEGPNTGADPCDLVMAARNDIGRALARKKFASKFFENGCQIGGLLMVPPGQDPIAQKKVEKGVEEKYRSVANAFKTMVLRDGYKFEKTGVDPKESQVVELDEADVRDVARWFNMRPSHLGIRDASSYNSLEMDRQDFFDSTLTPWLISRRTQCNAKLLTPSERVARRVFIEDNIDSLLWADAQTRSDIANRGVLNGIYTVDEVRAWSNRNPLPDGLGAKPFRPVNVVVAGEKPAPSTPADPGSARSLDAHRRLLAGAIARAARRVGVQAERAATSRDKLGDWLGRFEAEQRTVVAELLGEVLEACREAGDVDARWTGDRLAEQLLADLRSTISRETYSAATPATIVGDLIARYATTEATKLAARVLG